MIEIKHRWSGKVLYTAERAQDVRAALEEAVKERADLRGAYLRGADLRGADLRGADLRGADLQAADLQAADLRGAYLRGAYLPRPSPLNGAQRLMARIRPSGKILLRPAVEPKDANLNPVEARLPLAFNGLKPAEFIKRAYGLGADLNGPGRYELSDPVQEELRRIKGWIEMAEHDALEAREAGGHAVRHGERLADLDGGGGE